MGTLAIDGETGYGLEPQVLVVCRAKTHFCKDTKLPLLLEPVDRSFELVLVKDCKELPQFGITFGLSIADTPL